MFPSPRKLTVLVLAGIASLTGACGMKGSLALPPPEQRTPPILDRMNAPRQAASPAAPAKAGDASTDTAARNITPESR